MLGQEAGSALTPSLRLQRLLAFAYPTLGHLDYVGVTLRLAELGDVSPPVGGLVAEARAAWGVAVVMARTDPTEPSE